MTNGWPIQGSGEDFTKKLSLKWALMIGMDLKGGWRRKDIPSLQHKQRSRDGVLLIHRENHEQNSLNRQYLHLVEERRVLLLKIENDVRVLDTCFLHSLGRQ